MNKKIDIIVGEGQRISALLSTPEDESVDKEDATLIIMSHNFPGHKASNNDLFGDVEYALYNRGHHTLRFDYRGCGESDGKEQDFNIASACEDFKEVIFWGKANGYKQFGFIGEGLGASICIMNTDVYVRFMVLISPVLDLKTYAENTYDLLSCDLEPAKKKGFLEHEGHKINYHFLNECRLNDLAAAMNEMKMPVLIFHGAEDKVIPIKQLDLAREEMRSRRIEVTTFHNGGYGLKSLTHRKMLFYHTQQFVEKYI